MKVNALITILRKAIFLFWCVAYSCMLPAQSNITNTANNALIIHNAVNAYHRFLSPQTNLYNGSEYINYAYPIKDGHPFFETAQFNNGTIEYNGVRYEAVPLLYDEIIDEVIIKHVDGVSKIKLNKERVTSFYLLDHQFVHLIPDSFTHSSIRQGLL